MEGGQAEEESEDEAEAELYLPGPYNLLKSFTECGRFSLNVQFLDNEDLKALRAMKGLVGGAEWGGVLGEGGFGVRDEAVGAVAAPVVDAVKAAVAAAAAGGYGKGKKETKVKRADEDGMD